jgi:hypothetical protein
MANLPRVGQRYLDSLLPPDWQTYFVARAAGKYWGLSIVCPVCNERPPHSVKYGSQRWRWLSCHMAAVHQNNNRK